ncbi:ArsR/SmtB family transcription factor [Nonomuraea candida]|uniref:ArsR/SmtB family transcription factor n=1 Tax=Nonomuraea candida TaxID=359159 RepID=UPI0005B82519|nr:winged helix-turn-helix domain-containing protein [Nonomuraea candida]
MLRIHFTGDDLRRVRVAQGVDPFWEMVFSRHRLADPAPPAVLRPWLAEMRRARGRLHRHERVVTALTPFGPYFPDFITPAEGLQGLDAGLQAILRTPRARLRDELARLARTSPLPGWGRRLAGGETATLMNLAATLRAYQAIAIAPHHDTISAAVTAESARRRRDLAEGGVDGLLRGMEPLMRWRPPLLEVDYDVDRDLHLGGRGLLLIPSYFCRRVPVALADPELPPTLVYPIDCHSHWAANRTESLVALLGATRATVFAAIDGGATTTQLAGRAATSPASVSRHTRVLRDAGLIETHRHGTAVLHVITPLGRALLSAAR